MSPSQSLKQAVQLGLPLYQKRGVSKERRVRERRRWVSVEAPPSGRRLQMRLKTICSSWRFMSSTQSRALLGCTSPMGHPPRSTQPLCCSARAAAVRLVSGSIQSDLHPVHG